MDILRARWILREVSWHGDSTRLLQETGVDEGELAQAAEFLTNVLDAHLGPAPAYP